MKDKITMDLIAIGIFSIAVALFVLKIHIAKTKLEKKNAINLVEIDKEKVKQELTYLELKTRSIEWQRIQGYITEEEFQKEMAKIDKRLKELESLYGK